MAEFINFDFDTVIIEVPDADFVDEDAPLTTEVTAWALANKAKYGTIAWKGGTVAEPTWAWIIGKSPTYQATMIQGTPV